MKRILPVMLALVLMLSCSVPALAAKDSGAKELPTKVSTKVTETKKDETKKDETKANKSETNNSEAIAAAEAAALEAAGVERAATKYVDSHVEYQRGVAYAVHVEIGVYTKGVGTERSSYLVDIETFEILQPVEAID